MNTIVELPGFIRRAHKLLRETEHEAIIEYLAANPLAGVLLEGTGGIRKLRWKREGTGKSGGVRVIYFIMMDTIRCFCSRCLANLKNQTSARPNGTCWRN